MRLPNNLAIQTVLYGLPTILGRFLNYLLVPLHTHLFMPEEYGVVTKLYAMVALFNVLLTFGMETTYFRFAAQDVSKRIFSTAQNAVMLVSLLFAFVGFVFTDAWSHYILEPEHPEYIQIFISILVLDAMVAIPFARLRQEGKSLKFTIVRSVSIFSNIFFNMLFIVWLPDWIQTGRLAFLPEVFAAPDIVMVFIANFIASVLTLLLLLPQFKDIKYGIDRTYLFEMLSYSWPLLFVGLAGMVNETFDRILLEYLLEPSLAKRETGIYGACYKLSIIMSLFIQAYRFAAEPYFFGKRSSENRQVFADSAHYFAIFCFFIFLLVSVYLDYFKLFLRDASYHEGIDVVPILLLANLFLGVYYNLSVWYKLSDKTVYGAYISIFGALLTIVLNLLLIPVLGYRGSAWATLLVYLTMAVISYQMGQKHFRIPYQLPRFVVYLIASLSLFLLYQLGSNRGEFVPIEALRVFILISFVALVFIMEKPKIWVNSRH